MRRPGMRSWAPRGCPKKSSRSLTPTQAKPSEPTMDASKRDEYFKYWKRAVTKSFDWFDAEG